MDQASYKYAHMENMPRFNATNITFGSFDFIVDQITFKKDHLYCLQLGALYHALSQILLSYMRSSFATPNQIFILKYLNTFNNEISLDLARMDKSHDCRMSHDF